MRRTNGRDERDAYELYSTQLLMIGLVALVPSLMLGHFFYDLTSPGPVPPPDEARVRCNAHEPYNVSETQQHGLGVYHANSYWTNPQTRYSLAKNIPVQVNWILHQIECKGDQGTFHLLSIDDALGVASDDEIRAAMERAHAKGWRDETRWIYPWCTHMLWCLYDAPYEPSWITVTNQWVIWSAIVTMSWTVFAFALHLGVYVVRLESAPTLYHKLIDNYRRLTRTTEASSVV